MLVTTLWLPVVCLCQAKLSHSAWTKFRHTPGKHISTAAAAAQQISSWSCDGWLDLPKAQSWENALFLYAYMEIMWKMIQNEPGRSKFSQILLRLGGLPTSIATENFWKWTQGSSKCRRGGYQKESQWIDLEFCWDERSLLLHSAFPPVVYLRCCWYWLDSCTYVLEHCRVKSSPNHQHL